MILWAGKAALGAPGFLLFPHSPVSSSLQFFLYNLGSSRLHWIGTFLMALNICFDYFIGFSSYFWRNSTNYSTLLGGVPLLVLNILIFVAHSANVTPSPSFIPYFPLLLFHRFPLSISAVTLGTPLINLFWTSKNLFLYAASLLILFIYSLSYTLIYASKLPECQDMLDAFGIH